MKVTVKKVLESYIIQELHKIFSYKLEKEVIRLAVKNLSENERWALLEALAGSFEQTGIFSEISDSSYQWQFLEVPLAKIVLGLMYKQVNPILEKCDFKPLQVIAEMKNSSEVQGKFFAGEKFFLKIINFEPVLAIKQKEGFKLIDGHHRVLALGLLGRKKIKMFVASKIPGKKETKLLPEYPMHVLASIKDSARKVENIEVQEAMKTFFRFLKEKGKYRNISNFLDLGK